MNFKRYQHIERFGTDEVLGEEIGICYVFPKIDGTNSQCYLDDNGELKCGSRNRELTLDNDNAGFYNEMIKHDEIKAYLEKHPTHRLFGEWLCLSGDTIIRKTSGGKNSNYMTLKEMYDYSQKKTKETYKWTTKDGVQKTKN